MAEGNNNHPATKKDIERVVELVVRLHEDLDRRFEAVERRMDRLAEAVFMVQGQMTSLTR